MDEGYVKYRARFNASSAIGLEVLRPLIASRQRLYKENLIGVYPNGVGFGNLSARIPGEGLFVISGTATGHHKILNETHFSRVLEVDLYNNTLLCSGPIQASSEAMTHAIFYEEDPGIGGVAHVHHAGLWNALLNKVPTTPEGIAYGTPEMAWAMQDLLRNGDLKKNRIAVMHGHPEGIFAFGSEVEEAVALILEYWKVYCETP